MLTQGTEIAGYRIEGVLGHGGMGVVYEATQLSLNRTVAFKVLTPELGMDVSFRERFRREGQIQAAIDHPHIVTVHEAGELDDGLFLAMRLVRGPTLKDMIVARELEGARTLRILTSIADALDAAHEAGLIHRDVKPQNILVGARDHAYLADFGLTKGLGQSGLTRTGQFVGTIDYISPEQIRGEPAGCASDIYALAAVMFECLTGVIPYPKNSDAAVLYAHLSDEPPLVTDQRPELPPALDEVIARAMAKQPADRHQSASEFVSEAERAFGKRVRAVITPPGPVEAPEEAGIRPDEANVPTRETRLRDVPEAAPAPAAGPTRPADRPATEPPQVSEPAIADSASGAHPVPADATRAAAPPADVTRAAAPPADVTRAAAPPADVTRAAAPPADVTRAAAPADVTQAAPAAVPATHAAAAGRRGDTGTRRIFTGPLLAAAFVVAAVVAGLLVGGSGDDDGSKTPELPNSASSGDVGVRYPAGWSRSATPPELPGLELDGAVALAAESPKGAQVLFGKSSAGGTTLLPASFTDKLDAPPSAKDRVRLSDGVDAYRYAGLTPRGLDGDEVTMFVVPTSTGVATVACVAPPEQAAAFQRDCESVASTLELTGAKPLPLGPSTSYAQRLDRAVRGLNKVRTPLRAELRDARRPAGQARTADRLAGAYGAALRALPRAPGPAEQRVHAAIRDAMSRTRDAYERLSAAARRGDSAAFSAARQAVQTEERAVQRSLDALEPLGYSID